MQTIIKALAHVSKIHPTVSQVLYGEDLRWRYMTPEGTPIAFIGTEDIYLLETASDEAAALGLIDVPMSLPPKVPQDKVRQTSMLENELLTVRAEHTNNEAGRAIDKLLHPISGAIGILTGRPMRKTEDDYPDRHGEHKADAWNSACTAHDPYINALEAELAHWKAVATAYGETALYLQADRNKLRDDVAHAESSLERNLSVTRALRATLQIRDANFQFAAGARDELQIRNEKLESLLSKYSHRGLSPVLTETELDEIDQALSEARIAEVT